MKALPIQMTTPAGMSPHPDGTFAISTQNERQGYGGQGPRPFVDWTSSKLEREKTSHSSYDQSIFNRFSLTFRHGTAMKSHLFLFSTQNERHYCSQPPVVDILVFRMQARITAEYSIALIMDEQTGAEMRYKITVALCQ